MNTSTPYKWRSGLFAALSLLLSLATAYAHSPSFSEGLVQAQDPATKKWGYLNKKGEWALPPKFDKAYEFRSGRALTIQGDQTMFIEPSGKTAFVCQWKVEPWEGFQCGLLKITEEGKQGFVDTNGKLSIAPEYDKAEIFYEEHAAVSNGGKWGFIDTRGKVVVPLEWDMVGRFSEGLAWVSKDKKAGYIDKTGKPVIPLQYAQAKDFMNGIALVYDSAAKRWGVINTRGEVLTPPKWHRQPSVIGDDRIIFQEAITKTSNHLWGLADSKGKILVEPKWARVATTGFNSGLAVAVLPSNNGARYGSQEWWGKAGYIDRDGNDVIPCKFDYTNWFTEGLAFAKEGDKQGYIDTTGKFVFEMPK